MRKTSVQMLKLPSLGSLSVVALMYLCHHLKLFYLAQVLKSVTAWLCLNSGHTQLALSCCQPQPCLSLTAAITWGLLQIMCSPSAAAGSAGANLGLSVLKMPFPVDRAGDSSSPVRREQSLATACSSHQAQADAEPLACTACGWSEKNKENM